MDLRTNQPDSLSPFLYHERTSYDNLKRRVTSIQARVQELTATEVSPSRPKLEPVKKSMRSQGLDSLGKTGTVIDQRSKVEPDKGLEKGKNNRHQRTSPETADAVRQYLNLHCLRTRRHDQAINFLYGKSQGKQIHFDLFDAPSLKVNQDRLENGVDSLVFEDILQYVALLRFEVEQKQAKSQSTANVVQIYDQFADELQNINIPRASAIEPITFAVIDDGVGITDRRIVTKMMNGQSFLHRDTFQNRTVPYYVTATGHGTAVAVLVCRTPPRAKILALKLDERSDAQGFRRATLSSVTKAVRVAMEKNVDIIAIAWTVEEALRTKSDIDEFKAAIQDASRQGIIIFCATHDQLLGVNTALAASIRNNDVIIIGAAGDVDQEGRLPETTNGADFIFPGSDASSKFPNDPSMDKQESIPEVDVATALEAGLAGLLLYCVKLGAAISPQVAHEIVTTNDFKAFKSDKKMKMAFMSLSTSEHNLLDVWGSFERRRNRIESRGDKSMTDLIVGIAAWLVDIGQLEDSPARCRLAIVNSRSQISIYLNLSINSLGTQYSQSSRSKNTTLR
ncbi:hypothetical protein IFR05_013341 [Cadophora sp. M221]|nr:hypothetical protein IFR05_013341 [Cadophora sp. M221]